MTMVSGVYWIYQISLDRAVYVGSSKELSRRLSGHLNKLNKGKHPNRHLQSTWNKYGADDFLVEVLEECRIERLIEREQFWMDVMPTPPTCNTDGPAAAPMLGQKQSEETRKKISAAGMGRRHSEETRKKLSGISLGNHNALGCTRSEESRSRTANGMRGNKNCSGRTLSSATRLKIADSKRGNHYSRGRVLSDEARDRIRKAQTGRTHTEETRRKLREAWVRRRNRKNTGSVESGSSSAPSSGVSSDQLSN